MRGLITAIRTLTIIPLPGRQHEKFSHSLIWFPVIGLILGLILYGTGWLWIERLSLDWPGGGAVIVLILQVVLTRGLHLDGLADWADALGGKPDKASRLTVMKDPRVGAFGVIALVAVLLAKWVAIDRMFSSGSFLWIVFIMVISRDMMVVLMTTLPYARTGAGMASPFVKDIPHGHRLLAHTVCFFICLFAGPVGLFFWGSGWIITSLLRVSYRHGFGGITGDLLGATNEIVEMILLVIGATWGRLMIEYTGWGWLITDLSFLIHH
jgi:adenosylcobinamide-GDP ribazoletransferase